MALEPAELGLAEQALRRVCFEGHTDSAGPAGYNLSLSRVRAQAARYYLFREFAIRPDRIEAVGYGESQPVADNGTEAGRRANRRTVAAFSVNREYVPDNAGPEASGESGHNLADRDQGET